MSGMTVFAGWAWLPVLLLSFHGPRWSGKLPASHRVLLDESFRLADAVSDKVWPGWGKTPFPVLLVTADREYLMGYPETIPEGFQPVSDMRESWGPVYARPRTFPPNLLATFPAFGLIPVVVVGTPRATGKSPTEWVLTLLHEHFHQFQMSASGYYEAVQGLPPARGDPTGRWMLDYPFPYEDPVVGKHLRQMGKMLAALLTAPELDAKHVSQFWETYRSFTASLKPADYSYFSFQLWQEGVARYVELRVAEVAAQTFQTSSEFRRLHTGETFSKVAQRIRQNIIRSLRNLILSRDRRITFYPVGAGLALLLDRMGVPWKSRYHRERFYLERYAGFALSTP